MGTAARLLTPQQAQAIATREASVALSAGAGCGKTFVLTERFLAQLDPTQHERPAGLRELIAITFTERAAREMRERIRRKTLERLHSATTPQEADWWWKLLRELDSARVSTIHSFCGTLLRTHAVEAELDPGFQVLEASQSATLLTELTDDLLRIWLTEQNETVLDLTVRLGLDRLRQMLHLLRGEGRPSDWEAWSTQTADEQLDIWSAFHRERLLPQLLDRFVHSSSAAEMHSFWTAHEAPTPKLKPVRADLVRLLSNLTQSTTIQADLESIHNSARVQGLTTKKDWDSEEQFKQYKDCAAELRKQVEKLIPLITFDREAARPSAEAGIHLLALSQQVQEKYARHKSQLAVLDFDDLIAQAHRLLTHPEHSALRRRLSGSLALLLVDEFQDTDPVQVDLVRALCGDALTDGKLFFVGDRKQSIYRFRGAEPLVFQELQADMPAAGRLPLTRNFRSQPAVLDFVNGLFVETFQPGYERLEASREQVSPLPAVELWWSIPQLDGRVNVELQRRHEADFMARNLREMFDAQEPLLPDEKGTSKSKDKRTPSLRPVEYGDVAILFRALSDVRYYEQALQEYEIPYYLVGGHAFYAQQEVFDVLNLLRSLDSVADEVSMAGVLRSPFFACDDETLFWLAQHSGGLSTGLFAEKLPGQLTADQRSRCEFAANTLTELRNVKNRVPIAQLLQTALARTGYDAVLLSEFLGERKLANLRKLIDQARELDRAGVLTLSDFIVQLSEFVAEQPREALAATHPEFANVVRLMSIHQSKGLEFPVVVVADLDRGNVPKTPAATFHPDLGPLVKVTADDAEETAVVGLDMFRQMELIEEEAESNRVFYVAATRAADRLIFSSGIKDLEKPSGPWTKLLAERCNLTTGEFTAELPPDYPVPEIRVRRNPFAEAIPHTPRRAKTDWELLVTQASRLAEREQGAVPTFAGSLAPDPTARRHYSFSRLSGILKRLESNSEEEDSLGRAYENSPIPLATTKPGEVDSLELGTLIHAVLANLRWDGSDHVAELIQQQAELNAIENAATLAEAQSVLLRFLGSDRAKQISIASERWTELEFLLAWPPDTPVQNGSYLQGYLDCLYRAADGAWHLLDYKTNRVTPDTLAEKAQPYTLQLGVYALAIEKILGQAPATITLCFLRAGLEYRFDWNAAARRDTISQVNRALLNVSNSC